jgi:hypothetical protein
MRRIGWNPPAENVLSSISDSEKEEAQKQNREAEGDLRRSFHAVLPPQF